MKDVFFRALEIEPGKRVEWVAATCADDAELLREVASLLDEYREDDRFLAKPVVASPTGLGLGSPPAPPPPIPDQIGPYRITQRLGFGGMGVVYLAEQENPRRRIALKVLRHDCGGPVVSMRFEREALALGRMRHPSIAQIYEAGVAETQVGHQPYIAMELVQGAPIGQYCRRSRLDLSACIELFLQLCDAIHYAHGEGVVHRDLKPENVLVDNQGRVKVLDFGLARLEGAGENAFHTQTGQIVGTAAYMSPEQARGAVVDERSDLFSLGVMLYELASGRLPSATRDGYSSEESERSLVSVHAPELKGDFETIVEKTLEQDPARRYPTVAHLAEDVRRFQEGRPIHARPATTWYRTRKLVMRHRVLALSTSVVGFTLAVGLVIALQALRVAGAARDELARRNDAFLNLAHQRILTRLRAEAEDLWPVGPDLVPRLQTWLAEADVLAEHVPEHRVRLKEMVRLRDQGRLAEIDPTEQATPQRVEWLLEARERLLQDLYSFFGLYSDVPSGLYAAVRERLERSGELVAETIDRREDEWREAIAAIYDPDGPYSGLRIEPQIGLVPLGPDPTSQLWEFALYVDGGTVPNRPDEASELVVHMDSTVVLVLMPGGSFPMGSQDIDPFQPNYLPQVKDHEGPVRIVDLDPFFLGKHEVTQAQWVRVMEDNPSYWRPPKVHKEYCVTWLHPVEHVTWYEARTFCARLGTRLPTEARWEYAARAGNPDVTPATDWACRAHVGRDRSDPGPWAHPTLRGRQANGLAIGIHAPVGMYVADRLGLYDMFGNVMEWSVDVYKTDLPALVLRAGDGLVLTKGDEGRSVRGGSYAGLTLLYAGKRTDFQARDHSANLGLRVSRDLGGRWSRTAVPNSGSPSAASLGMSNQRSDEFENR